MRIGRKTARRGLLVLLLLVPACASGGSASSPEPTDASPSPMRSGAPSLPPLDIEFEVPPTTPMSTYEDERAGFSIDYPRRWTVAEDDDDECRQLRMEVCFFAPAQDGQVPAGIGVDVFRGTRETNIQPVWNTKRQLFINSLGSQPRTVPGTQGNTTMDDRQAKTATYTLNWGLIPATARQTMVLGDDQKTAYTVSEISATSIWDDVVPAFDDVEGSFTLID